MTGSDSVSFPGNPPSNGISAATSPALPCPAAESTGRSDGREGWGCEQKKQRCPLDASGPYQPLAGRKAASDMRAVIGTGISKSMRACSPAAIAHAPAFRPAGDGQQDLATDTHLADGRKACVTIPPFFVLQLKLLVLTWCLRGSSHLANYRTISLTY